MKRTPVLLSLAACAGALLISQTAQAGTVVFTLNQSMSQLTLSGNVSAVDGSTKVGPSAITAQDKANTKNGDPGSLVSHQNGTLVVNEGSGNISFPGGSVINAVNYSGATIGGTPVNLAPAIGGAAASPTAPADYGFSVSLVEIIFQVASGPLAIRNMVNDFASNTTIPTTGTPTNLSWASNTGAESIVSNGSLPMGSLDYYVTLGTIVGGGTVGGTTTISGLPLSANSAPTHGTLVTSGLNQTITVPIAQTITYTDAISSTESITVNLTLTGSLVGTGIVPEPGSFALLGVGLAALVPLAVRRFRRARSVGS